MMTRLRFVSFVPLTQFEPFHEHKNIPTRVVSTVFLFSFIYPTTIFQIKDLLLWFDPEDKYIENWVVSPRGASALAEASLKQPVLSSTMESVV